MSWGGYPLTTSTGTPIGEPGVRGAAGFAGALAALAVLLLAAACGVGALVVAQRGSSVVPEAIRKAFCQCVETAPYSEPGGLCYPVSERFLESVTDPVTVGGLVALCKEKEEGYRRRFPDGRGPYWYLSNYWEAQMACLMRLSDLGKAGDPRALDALLHEVASGGYDGEGAATLSDAIYEIGPSVLPRLRDYRGRNKLMVEIVVECLAEGHPPI